ncbi:Uncharacterised protein [uncultured archaeon]|nr:Uncharacterised protein [uncultured archaeon]
MRITPQVRPEELREALSQQRRIYGITLPDATREQVALDAELAFSAKALHISQSMIPAEREDILVMASAAGREIDTNLLPAPRQYDLVDQLAVQKELRFVKPQATVWKMPTGVTYLEVLRYDEQPRFTPLGLKEGSEAVEAAESVKSGYAVIARNVPYLASEFASTCFYAAYLTDDPIALTHAPTSSSIRQLTEKVGAEAGGLSKVELVLVKGNGSDSRRTLPRLMQELGPLFEAGLVLRAVDWTTPPAEWKKPEGVEDARPPDPNFPRGENYCNITVHQNPKRVHVIRYQYESNTSPRNEYDL